MVVAVVETTRLQQQRRGRQLMLQQRGRCDARAPLGGSAQMFWQQQARSARLCLPSHLLARRSQPLSLPVVLVVLVVTHYKVH